MIKMGKKKFNLIELLSPTENRIKLVETRNTEYLTLGFLESFVRGSVVGSLAGAGAGLLGYIFEGKYNQDLVLLGGIIGGCADELVNVTRTLCLALARIAGPKMYVEHLKKFYNRDPKYPELLNK